MSHLLAVISQSTVVGWGAIVVSILGGGLTMAWRLGRLEQAVHDLTQRMDRHDGARTG